MCRCASTATGPHKTKSPLDDCDYASLCRSPRAGFRPIKFSCYRDAPERPDRPQRWWQFAADALTSRTWKYRRVRVACLNPYADLGNTGTAKLADSSCRRVTYRRAYSPCDRHQPRARKLQNPDGRHDLDVLGVNKRRPGQFRTQIAVGADR